jgi:cytosine/adenosine deaminase-related metal-dependent hydrolase
VTYTDEDLRNGLCTFADKEYDHDRAPTQADVHAQEDLPAVSTFISRFGSWSAAVKAAGFTPRLPRWSDDELLDALRAFADEESRPPTAVEANARKGFPSAQTFVEHFGSWNAALDTAGLTPRNRRRTDEELLADLRKFADEHGTVPSAAAVREQENMATPPTYRNRFGSWNEALDAAGLPTFAANGETEED